MQDAMSYVIQEVAHHVTLMFLWSASVEKKRKEYHAKYQIKQISLVRTSVENYWTVWIMNV